MENYILFQDVDFYVPPFPEGGYLEKIYDCDSAYAILKEFDLNTESNLSKVRVRILSDYKYPAMSNESLWDYVYWIRLKDAKSYLREFYKYLIHLWKKGSGSEDLFTNLPSITDVFYQLASLSDNKVIWNEFKEELIKLKGEEVLEKYLYRY